MSTPWSSVERPGSTQHQSGRRSEPSEAHGGLDRLDAKLRMRGWCQGRLCRRAAVDRPLTPAPQPNTTIQAIKTDTHDPARHLMVATETRRSHAENLRVARLDVFAHLLHRRRILLHDLDLA